MFQQIARFILISVTITLGAACGSSSSTPAADPAAPTPEPAAAPAGDSLTDAEVVNHCVAIFTRQHDCTDDYIPALVDTRIDLDLPPGIAQHGATPEGRAELYDIAKQEWAVDGVEPKRTQTCEMIVQKIDAQTKAEAANIANTCLAKSSCGEFVDCIMPFQRAQMEAANARMGGAGQ